MGFCSELEKSMSTPIGMTGQARVTSVSGRAAAAAYASASKVALFDDFLGDVLADQWNYVEGTDTATADGAILAGGQGGVLRITSGDAGTGLAADLAVVNSALQWKASAGGLIAEARVKPSAIAAGSYYFFGFTDTLSLEAPVESAASGNTLTSNASDAVGFMFDTRMTDDNLWLVGVKADVDATAQDSEVALTAAEYVTLKVEVTATGDAIFFVNGQQVGSILEDAVTPGTALTPVFANGKSSATVSNTLDVDYVNVSANRV
jgi:hypothetical protein